MAKEELENVYEELQLFDINVIYQFFFFMNGQTKESIFNQLV